MRKVFDLDADLNLGFNELFRLGKYSWNSSWVTPKNFRCSWNGRFTGDVVLYSYGRAAETPRMKQALVMLGFKPAELSHLLAFGAHHKDIPGIDYVGPLAALGTIWDGFAPALAWHHMHGRGLDMYRADGAWPASAIFLGVREKS